MRNKLLLMIGLCFCALFAGAQTKNTSTEVKDYREVDGKIILTLAVNGELADFVLDLAGHMAVLPEYVEKLHIDPSVEAGLPYKNYLFRGVPVDKVVLINTIAFGNSVFGNGVSAFVLKDEPYLRELGVAGVVNGSLFRNTVMTIDSRRKKITMSSPYRPDYMKLDHRANMELVTGFGLVCPVTIDGVEHKLLFDTWTDGMIAMTEEDFQKFSGKSGGKAMTGTGYGKADVETSTKVAGTCSFVKDNFSEVTVVEGKGLTRSMLGNDILDKGLVSLDFARQRVYFQPFDLMAVKDEVTETEVRIEAGKVNPITREYFLEHIFDYRKGGEFVSKSDKPVVIDFWATWCGPCMKLLPFMEQLAEKYKDQVIFLKVDADKEKELCSMYNVNALPTLFFIPVGGKPIVEVGGVPEKIEQAIKEHLLK